MARLVLKIVSVICNKKRKEKLSVGDEDGSAEAVQILSNSSVCVRERERECVCLSVCLLGLPLSYRMGESLVPADSKVGSSELQRNLGVRKLCKNWAEISKAVPKEVTELAVMGLS